MGVNWNKNRTTTAMVHYCVVPGCHNSSVTHPHLSFHRLPLKNKALLKFWVHKIGRRNLPLNNNSRVCSEHFVKSADHLLRKDEYPTMKLPRLATRVVTKPRRPPIPRVLPEESEVDVLSDAAEIPDVTLSLSVDASSNTDLTGTDMEQLMLDNSKLTEEVSILKQEVLAAKFCLDNIANSNKKVSFYTGFPSIASLNACFNYSGPSVNELTYWNPSMASPQADIKSKGRKRKLSPREEFFMVLVRLRLGSLEQDLADRFGVSCSTVSRVFTTWINFLYLKFKELPLWPPQEIVQGSMPSVFRELYPMTRVVLDATEIFIEKPSLPDVQQMTFSSYKNDNTFKALVGISPSGVITFVSDLYPGCISDKELTRRSGILGLLQRGDRVMADRGFDIQDDLTPLGVKLNMPPFLRGKTQLDTNEMVETRRIASVRIHVERAMERIKNYHIFDKVIPASLTDLANQIFFVCAVLSNFWPPLCQ